MGSLERNLAVSLPDRPARWHKGGGSARYARPAARRRGISPLTDPEERVVAAADMPTEHRGAVRSDGDAGHERATRVVVSRRGNR